MPTVIPVTSITTNTFSTNGRDHGLCRQDQRVRALSGIRFHDEVKDTNPCQFSVISDPFPVSVRHCETCVEHDSASRTATLLVLSSAAARAWFIPPDFPYSHRHLGLGIGESGHAHTLDLFQAISNFRRFFLARQGPNREFVSGRACRPHRALPPPPDLRREAVRPCPRCRVLVQKVIAVRPARPAPAPLRVFAQPATKKLIHGVHLAEVWRRSPPARVSCSP